MKKDRRFSVVNVLLVILGISSLSCAAYAQRFQEPGKSLGTISVKGNLIVMTLDEGVLGKANLFDLAHHTLRFTPDGSRYRVENLPLQWDSEFGPAMSDSHATLKSFEFPFSGKSWNTFSVGMTGSMTFGEPSAGVGGRGGQRGPGGAGNRSGGISVDRFAELAEAAPQLINTVAAISVFFKPRLSGTRYLKELDDRAVITWSLTEPVGGVQDMTWTPTVNRFQAVLHKDGTIDLSYEDVHAEDAIVGIYPMVTAGSEKEIGTVSGAEKTSVASNLNIKSVKLTALDGLFLKATIETYGPVLAESDPKIAGIGYRICFDEKKPTGACTQNSSATTVWNIVGFAGGRGGGRLGGSPRYIASGTGISPAVKVDGNTISVQGTLPAGYKDGDQIFVSVSALSPGAAPASDGTPSPAPQPVTVDQVPAHPVKLAGLINAAADLSSLKKQDGPFPVVYEAFHYMKPPRAMDLTCTVINALGDKFDMLAYYSDFRIDNPEAGTSSTGPLGGGPDGGAVTGIGANQRNLASYCTKGRFQWQFIQPVYVGANQMQEYPPADLKEGESHNIGFYMHQLQERTVEREDSSV